MHVTPCMSAIVTIVFSGWTAFSIDYRFGGMKPLAFALVALCMLDATSAVAQAVTDVVVIRRSVSKPLPNNGKSAVVKHCGTMTGGTPWGIDGEGYTKIGTANTDAQALELCEARYLSTKKAGVCGYNNYTGYSVYYWGTTNTRTVATNNRGTICK